MVLSAHRRRVPWSDRTILFASLLSVLVITPVWLDPMTLSEVAGRPAALSTGSARPSFGTIRPDIQPAIALTDATLAIHDDFARSLSSGWGTAETGGAYSASGVGTLSVANGRSTAQLDPGAEGAILMSTAPLLDGVLEYTLEVDSFPTTAELIAYTLVRALEPTTAYRLGLHFTAAGIVYAGIDVLVDGATQHLSQSVAVAGAPTTAGAPAPLRVRVEVFGSDPTRIRLRAWPETQPEPTGWHIGIIDWNGALQGRSSFGLGWGLDGDASSGATLHFSNLSAWDISGGSQ